MLTKLKNLFLSSVDLVHRGANQEADICLFKSADAPEQDSPAILDNETALVYTGALAKSILSIQEDESLDVVEKMDMIQKSFAQFGEAVEKLNAEAETSEPGEIGKADSSMLDMIEEIETKKA